MYRFLFVTLIVKGRLWRSFEPPRAALTPPVFIYILFVAGRLWRSFGPPKAALTPRAFRYIVRRVALSLLLFLLASASTPTSLQNWELFVEFLDYSTENSQFSERADGRF